MQRTKRYLARLLALVAIAAVAIAVVLIVSSFKDESNDKSHRGRGGRAQHAKQHRPVHKSKAKSYTIQSGDTLTSIAHKTGLTVQEIQALNPEIDPQILIAGEVLKLR